MKQFLKNVAATVLGVIIAGSLAGVFFFIALMGLALSDNDTTSIKDNSVLVVKLSGVMNEHNDAENPLDALMDKAPAPSVSDIVQAVKKAKTDSRIKGIYIEAGLFAADSYASMEAVHDALADFRKSGKWIIAYGDSYTQGAYYIASTASKLYLNPQGQIDWHGLSAQKLYFKDLLAKFGVKIQVAKVGTYKSATEMFTADKMSDADRAQTTAYIGAIWKNITAAVSKSRNIPVARLNQLADSMIVLADPTDYVKAKMVDGLLYTDQVKGIVKKQLGSDDICQVTPGDVNADETDDSGDEIAVYYACGSIVDGDASIDNGQCIDAQKVCRDLEDLADDDDVKAVVLRINSGGGSAYASEQIWHQVSELKKKKPVVVSMGGMAASGAYYMSAPASWIVAQPMTITGSIGIFGMFPDMSGLLQDKLGIKFDVANTNAHSDFTLDRTPVRPFNGDEMRCLETYINRGYRLFRQRVADGRHLSTDQVEKIAQGHVYAAQDAMALKLVDQIGGLNDAVAKAAQLAKVKDYHTTDYPEGESFIDALLDKAQGGGNYLDERMQTELGMLYEPVMLLRKINKMDAIQASIPYKLEIK